MSTDDVTDIVTEIIRLVRERAPDAELAIALRLLHDLAVYHRHRMEFLTYEYLLNVGRWAYTARSERHPVSPPGRVLMSPPCALTVPPTDSGAPRARAFLHTSHDAQVLRRVPPFSWQAGRRRAKGE